MPIPWRPREFSAMSGTWFDVPQRASSSLRCFHTLTLMPWIDRPSVHLDERHRLINHADILWNPRIVNSTVSREQSKATGGQGAFGIFLPKLDSPSCPVCGGGTTACNVSMHC